MNSNSKMKFVIQIIGAFIISFVYIILMWGKKMSVIEIFSIKMLVPLVFALVMWVLAFIIMGVVYIKNTWFMLVSIGFLILRLILRLKFKYLAPGYEMDKLGDPFALASGLAFTAVVFRLIAYFFIDKMIKPEKTPPPLDGV